MDNKGPPITLATLILICLSIDLILFSDPSIQLGFQPRLITRFCYNSPNLSTVNVLGCTGSTALTMNITSAQAFCIISQCLGQVRQSPMFIGRRKRQSDEMDYLDAEQFDEADDTKHRLDRNNPSQNDTRELSSQSFRIVDMIEADIIDADNEV
ncbi:hypothetical protein SSS_03959 [Sarcoptes scabiei]|uniref:Uncharacterized protein n=1 Tax=Sarcoptes scabiei TaxID=52283 RepID=A0A834RFA1_SARSC|nr:hypothetical protein SSS_03959 [Sarcoptes scabiei]